MATKSVPSETVEKEREALLKLLQHDPDASLDVLVSGGLTAREGSEALEDVTDPRRKSGELVLRVRRDGAVSWQPFPQCLYSAFPGSAAVWHPNPSGGKLIVYTLEGVTEGIDFLGKRKCLPFICVCLFPKDKFH